MSALEDSLRKVYKLPQAKPRLMDGSPLPEGMVPGPTRTLEYRDANQNGIEDRSEGIYLPKDLVPASSIPQMTEAQKEYQRRFFVTPPEGGFRNMDPGFLKNFPKAMPSDTDPLDEMDEETRQELQDLLGKAGQKAQAPLAGLAEQIAMAGEGEDTALAHLRPGEIVIPPEFMDDAGFESALEKKFKEFDIDPEQAVVGAGIASLNPQTGLEQFGFFKKLGKKLKKVAKKIAPIAGPLANFIPGVGPVLAGAIGAATNVAAGKGLKGAITGGLSGFGTGKLFSGVGSLGNVGGKLVGKGGFSQLGTLDKFRALGSGLRSGNLASTFFNPATGDKGIFGGSIGPSIRRGLGSLTGFGQPVTGGLQPGPMPGQVIDTTEVIGTLDGQPVTRADLANMNADQIGAMQMTQAAVNDKTLMQRLSAMFLPQSVEDALGTGPGGGGIFGGGQGGGGGLFGGGFGDALKMGGIGALAAGLGKLAYEDAKKQTGVPLTPLTTMSPTGRYNIEAEIARRTGQPTPNPVEFGLLPEGTIPELSGGKPKGMMYGGPVEDLTGGMAMGMQEGGAANPTIEIGGLRKITGAQVTPEEIRAYFGPRSGRLITQDELNTAMAIPPMTPGTKPPESTQEVIEEAMEVVRLAEQEPAIKDTPEYQEALNILQRQMLTAAVMGKGPAMGGIKPLRNPLAGPASGVASAIGSLANTKLKMRMGRAAKAAQDAVEGIAAFGPNLPIEKMYGGPVMAYAQGGAVALQEGGELDPSQFPRMDGDINGPGTETSDDIPAMLSDGEFVMTGRAVRGAGSYEMQKDNKGIISLIPSFNEDRERGMDLMYKMMDTFAGEAKPS
jgi:hypothetical protein